MEPIVWENGVLRLLDQRYLPHRIDYVECRNFHEVAEAIREMVVRGAPAIGVAAAFGMVLAARELKAGENCERLMNKAASTLKATRPTAVNLAWALERMIKRIKEVESGSAEAVFHALEKEALSIFQEDVEINMNIGKQGAVLVPRGGRILTHCNAGALATAGYGTALGVVRTAFKNGRVARVYAGETRPYLQGSRLTAWELSQEGIPVTLITDNAAGFLMFQRKIDLVIVGADRIAINGDVVNKIGTYSLAVLAKENSVPFYVAAPLSTFDRFIDCGNDIIIEERDPREVTTFAGKEVAPVGVEAYNPSFDVTPSSYITAIITERGIIFNPDCQKIVKLIEGEKYHYVKYRKGKGEGC